MSGAKTLCLTLARTGETLATRARVADTYWTRLVGLLGSPPLAPGEGLLITPCHSVHSFGMRYAIDVAYLSADGRVLRLASAMPPWRFHWPVKGACAVLELPAGTLEQANAQVGDAVSGLEQLTSL
jgi:uncharacterized membrane protein (UPF0127 family)